MPKAENMRRPQTAGADAQANSVSGSACGDDLGTLPLLVLIAGRRSVYGARATSAVGLSIARIAQGAEAGTRQVSLGRIRRPGSSRWTTPTMSAGTCTRDAYGKKARCPYAGPKLSSSPRSVRLAG